MSRLLRRHPPRPRGASLSRARRPRKERRTTLPSRPPAVLFPFKSLHVAGGEGGAWTSLSYILFPCVRAGIFFFPSSTPSPLPAPPSLIPFPPSLPPLSARFVRWDARAPPQPGRAELAAGVGSPEPPPSPFPFPAPSPHPRLGLGAAARGTPR